MMNWWGVQGALPGSVGEVLQWWAGGAVKMKERLLWNATPLAVLWSLWKLRNECLFKASSPILAKLCEFIKIRIALWVNLNFKEFHFTINDFVFNFSHIRTCLGRRGLLNA
ncbi:hypothetical protein CsSME_00011953 [Camellia sinensis var. sinensis]